MAFRFGMSSLDCADQEQGHGGMPEPGPLLCIAVTIAPLVGRAGADGHSMNRLRQAQIEATLVLIKGNVLRKGFE